MPIYEYGCPKCGDFEYRQSINDKALTRCPTCKSKVTKLISRAGFQLKGGGWYSDSYQKKSSSGSSTPSSSSGSGSGGSSDSSGGSSGGSSAASAD